MRYTNRHFTYLLTYLLDYCVCVCTSDRVVDVYCVFTRVRVVDDGRLCSAADEGECVVVMAAS